MTSILTVQGATKTYLGAAISTLQDIHLELTPGEAFVILGATGSGKSTLLRSVAGLESLDSGSISLQDDARLAVVFQQAALFPWLTVRKNIELGAKFKSNEGRVKKAHVDELIGILGLQGLENRAVSELSGGQAQRVSIGRALAINPSLLLLDEPFSALDPATRSELQTWLRDLIEHLNLTVLMVSHDIPEAITVADRIGFFEAHQGFTRFWKPRTEHVDAEEILAHYRSVSSSNAVSGKKDLIDA